MKSSSKFNKEKTLTVFHIITLLAGCVVFIGGIFQSSIWFDEAYTIGLVNHSFYDMLRISCYDVHPALYYILLKLFTCIFGTSIPVMRLFSALGAIAFASLGFTHVRKDLGKETGFWFTFVSITFSSILVYALQIRMYTWAAYFVGLSAIYAYRRAKGEDTKRNRVFFVLFSVCAAYTHYFALFTIAAINIMLLVKDIREKKNLKTWFILGAIQIGAYIPGVLVFLFQISLSGASWMSIEWPDLVFDLTSYHLLGDAVGTFQPHGSGGYLALGGIFTVLYVLMFILINAGNKKDPARKDAVVWARTAYFSVLIFAVGVSLFRVIYYIRYTFILNFFLVLMVACLISRYRHSWQKIITVLLLCAIFGYQSYGIYDLMYDSSGTEVKQYIDPQIKEDDIFLFDDIKGYCISVNYINHPVYFFNKDGWTVETTYKAFGPKAYVLGGLNGEELNNVSGRIWVIDRGACYDYLKRQGNYKVISDKKISVRYHNYNHEIILMEKQ
jgi:uncharacterized membrane protein